MFAERMQDSGSTVSSRLLWLFTSASIRVSGAVSCISMQRSPLLQRPICAELLKNC